MSGKYEFDATRDAIGTNKMDDAERKAMLEKFKASGGQVLSEKELKEKQRRGGGDVKLKYGGGRSRGAGGYGSAFSDEAGADEKKKKKQGSGVLSKFFIKLKTFFAGLTPLFAPSIKPSFFSYLSLEVKQALVEFNLIGNDLFLQNKEVGKLIAKELDKKNPILMETLERAHNLFSSPDFNKLLEFHQSNPDVNIPFHAVGDHIKDLYRRIYYLYPFQETLKKAFGYALDVYRNHPNPNSTPALLDQKKKRFIKDLKTVFQGAFPKLFLLICRIDEFDYYPFSMPLEKALKIDQNAKLGRRKSGEASTLASSFIIDDGGAGTPVDSAESEGGVVTEGEPQGEEGGAQEQEAEQGHEQVNPITQTKEYQYGMKLMTRLDLTDLKKKFDPHHQFEHLKYQDKALQAFLFFMEFDKELSFVLTTNKIKLTPDFSTGTKRDYKQILTDLFNGSRNIMHTMEKFSEASKEYHKLDKTPSTGGNYVEASKRKEKLKSQVDMEARTLRGMVRSYMDNVAKNMAVLIADMKGERVIVDNMDEELQFSSELEGSKRLNGQPVKQCIMEAYCYSLALAQRLTDGDLFGGILEMTEEEMISSYGKNYTND